MLTQPNTRNILVCLISQDEKLILDVNLVLDNINSLLNEHNGTSPCQSPPAGDDMFYHQMLEQARHYFSQHQAKNISLSLTCFNTVATALESQAANPQPQSPIECVLLDARDKEPEEEDPFLPFINSQPDALFSPYSTMLLCREDALGKWMNRSGSRKQVRVLHSHPWHRRADILRLILDHLEHAYFSRILMRTYQNGNEPGTLAKTIHRHMTARWGDRWDFHYFTGSMVGRFINSMKALMDGSDPRCLTGNNEHSLAVSALAGWQLYGRAYVIAMTSGMIDEMRGTLANLKHAGAPGMIVCAESLPTVWYPFQGTLDAANDGHAVIAARGLWHCFISTPENLVTGIQGAFQSLDRQPAPTFVLATQTLLESQLDEPEIPPPPARIGTTLSADQRERLNQAIAAINHDRARILWHCDLITEEERTRVLRLTAKAGIGLVDSIIHPGSVPAYRKGEPVQNYLGTLSMYGFNRATYEFLETPPQQGEGKPWLFFLNSRIEQSATPYSAIKLKRNFNVVQVTRDASHLSPFTHLALDMGLTDFLDYLEPRLDVDPEVLPSRLALLERLRGLPAALPSESIETMPMTPNYFFTQLSELLTDLIQQQGYRYTGVYDVGRCSLSAIRNVVRTDHGFSGWYGRALMGDGLMSLPYIALNNEHNLLAFIGDGARALVPDIEQRLIMSSAKGLLKRGGNVTIFYLTNGGLSMIQSYLDKRYMPSRYQQVDIPMAETKDIPDDSTIHGVNVHRRTLRQFCPTTLREALTAPGRINVFDVWLGHNSEGDGLSLTSEDFWSRRPIANGEIQ